MILWKRKKVKVKKFKNRKKWAKNMRKRKKF